LLASNRRSVLDRNEGEFSGYGAPTQLRRTDHLVRMPEVISRHFPQQKCLGRGPDLAASAVGQNRSDLTIDFPHRCTTHDT